MLRRFVPVAVGVLMILAGCRDTDQGAPSGDGAEGAPASAATAAGARAAAETVVAELYRRHAAGDTPFFQTDSRDKVDAYFERSLADLIWKDAVASSGEVGVLGFDPLYDAQDTEIKNLVVHPAQTEGGAVRVVVSFENFGKPERVTYTLVPAGNEWRIADVAYGGGATLRGILSTSAGPS